MKKIVAFFLAVLVAVLLPIQTVGAVEGMTGFVAGQKAYFINGQKYEMDVAVYLSSDGRTMVPVRFLAYILGMNEHGISWDGSTGTVTLTLAEKTVALRVGDPGLVINGKLAGDMDTLPVLDNGRVFLPARFVAEAFGKRVAWEPASQRVIIGMDQGSSNGPVLSAASAPAVQHLLDDLTPQLSASQFKSAKKTMNAYAPQNAAQKRFKAVLEAWLERLVYQDFAGAEEKTGSVMNALPNGIDAAAANQTLSSIIRSVRGANFERQKLMAEKTYNSTDSPVVSTSYVFKPKIKGKVIVWDSQSKSIDKSYAQLPDALRATAENDYYDENLTIIRIESREFIQIGTYEVSNRPAFQEQVRIGVYYWPEKKSPGTGIINGPEPDEIVKIGKDPVYGEAFDVAAWIESLPYEAGQ